jgi:hypothetical protein
LGSPLREGSRNSMKAFLSEIATWKIRRKASATVKKRAPKWKDG